MGVTGLVGSIAGWLMPKPASDSTEYLRAFRAAHTTAAPPGVTDPWQRRVMELCDGRPVARVLDALYIKQIRAGAAAADIGLWRRLFDQNVLSTLGDLAKRGYISLRDERRADLVATEA